MALTGLRKFQNILVEKRQQNFHAGTVEQQQLCAVVALIGMVFSLCTRPLLGRTSFESCVTVTAALHIRRKHVKTLSLGHAQKRRALGSRSHSRPQRLRSIWPAPLIETSGRLRSVLVTDWSDAKTIKKR